MIRQSLVPALVAAFATLVTGFLQAQRVARVVRGAGLGVGEVTAAWKSELYRWSGLAIATAFAVFVVVAVSRIAHERQSRVLDAMLVLAAPALLLSVGIVAYLPERDLIRQGWYANVGELPLWWGVLCGGIVISAAEAWYRLRSRGRVA